MNYKISVIFPIYNQEKLLERAIKSVINQSIGFENIELLLIDDCSTDNTKEIIKHYSTHYENIKGIFLEKNSGGAAKPRNKGIESSNGKYLMFLDPDDYYLKDTCKLLYNEIETENVDHVHANLIMSFNDNYYKRIYNKSEYISNSLINREWVGCNEDITKRELIKNKIQFPEEFKIGEDSLYGIKLCLNAKKIKYINKDYVKVYFSDNSNSVTHESYLKIISDRINVFRVTYNLKKEYIQENEINFINSCLNMQMMDIIGELLRSNLNKENKSNVMNKIYQLKLDCKEYKAVTEPKWSVLIRNCIYKKHFTIASFLSYICGAIFETNFFIKHFRNRNYTQLSEDEIESLNLNWIQ